MHPLLVSAQPRVPEKMNNEGWSGEILVFKTKFSLRPLRVIGVKNF
jgi:hypothetical protein